MICPKCGAEYRQGYTSCADCEVDLVAAPPDGGTALAAFLADEKTRSRTEAGDPTEDPFCSFWKGNEARVCAELCTVLDEAGIPHKTVHRRDHLFNLNNQSSYELGVPASLYEQAELAVKEAFGTDEETGDDAVPLLPAPDRRQVGLESLPDAVADANEWLGPRYPEDATIEVWSGEDLGVKEMIEMSLRENDLLCRVEEEGDKHKVFVLSGNELRAKEIVREVVEGRPMD